MAVSLKHKFQSAKAAGTDNTLVQPTNWNDEHNLLMDADNLLGRATAGNGAVEQIPCASYSRSLLAQTAATGWVATLGALPAAGGTISGALGVSGAFIGTSGHFTTTFAADGLATFSAGLTVAAGTTTTQAINGAAATFSSLNVSGATTLAALSATSLSFSGSIAAPNTCKAYMRWASGGLIGSFFGISTATSSGGGVYLVTLSASLAAECVQITPEGTLPFMCSYVWLASNVIELFFFDKTGAGVNPAGWSIAVFTH